MFDQDKHDLTSLEQQLNSFTPNESFPHDAFVKVSVEQALIAAKEGNIGVGGCIVKDGKILFADRNRQFVPTFKSDRHAEMELLNSLEEKLADEKQPNMSGYQLFSSWQPCPMCTLRLVTSGVNKVFYPELESDSADQAEQTSLEVLPPVWQHLANERQHFGKATCSQELIDLAAKIFFATAGDALETISQRR